MDILALLEGFANRLLELQQEFMEEGRFDVLEREAAEAGTQTIAQFLSLTLSETDAYIRDSGVRRRDYTIQRQVSRTLITTVGDVTFENTLYQKRSDKTYHYLLAEMMGLPAHERLSEQAEAKILKDVSTISYQRTADRLRIGNQKISKQAVKEKVHRSLSCFREEEALPDGEKKKCEYLYIEADEDHIHEQRGEAESRGFLGKLIYLYEGKEDVNKGKRRLIHPFYQGGLYSGAKGNRELWERVQRYIEGHYDTDSLKCVYISGDGAGWIKAGTAYVYDSVLVADRFHLMKYINRAANLTLDDAAWVKERFYKYIHQNDLQALYALLKKIQKSCRDDETIEACKSYFSGNWEAIQRAFHDKNVSGCSAEGHVSHVYSDRMSSRPMGWSKTGASAMCHLRCYVRNHGEEKVIDLVRYRREKELEKLEATGTEGIVRKEAGKHRTKQQQMIASYWEKMQASIGGLTARKTLAIRRRLSEI